METCLFCLLDTRNPFRPFLVVDFGQSLWGIGRRHRSSFVNPRVQADVSVIFSRCLRKMSLLRLLDDVVDHPSIPETDSVILLGTVAGNLTDHRCLVG